MRFPTMHDYLSPEHAAILEKIGEEERPAKRIAKTVGSGLAGMGLGYLAGGGSLHLADKLHQKYRGSPIPSSALSGAVPILGAAGGLAYTLYKAHEAEEVRRALESSKHQSTGRVSD